MSTTAQSTISTVKRFNLKGSARFILSAALCQDAYKAGHPFQYPADTEEVYANLTPRSAKIAIRSGKVLDDYDDKVSVVGTQSAFMKIAGEWQETFFNIPKEEAVGRYLRIVNRMLTTPVTGKHLEDLHDLGYLPLEVRIIPEGSRTPIKIPVMEIRSTKKGLHWVTNFIETHLSSEAWPALTTATLAYEFRLMLMRAAYETGVDLESTKFQGHDFSLRGIMGIYAGAMASYGHITVFLGTDSFPALEYGEFFYGASPETEFVAGSVPATEHAVTCAGGAGFENELKTYKYITKVVYPNGFVSVVSDTWNLWDVIGPHKGSIASQLKKDIMERGEDAMGNSKVVFRPDSGNPEQILCGTQNTNFMHYEKGSKERDLGEAESLGVIRCLWNQFQGTQTSKGYNQLHSKVGVIYGDSIHLANGQSILRNLNDQGFASNCTVFGIGSYYYQYNTRDTFGIAMKTTAVVRGGVDMAVFKDPVTDSGMKKSAVGYLIVTRDAAGEFKLLDNLTREQYFALKGTPVDSMKTLFLDGEFTENLCTLASTRAMLEESLMKDLKGRK